MKFRYPARHFSNLYGALQLLLSLNRLPDDNILSLSKLKAFADDNFIVAQTVHIFFDRVKDNVVKCIKDVNQDFLLFTCF